ncbi:hypothetical protein PL321_10570 [Caloramator sp. mosi_1]|uniref:hypothetical protein n=1 Tax=Caloramator sp. mosi_1 TaxID=3023090 RepID=UPI0023604E48|nr:hypothetical protein [Caloramator sp. mosi_1]WDC83234.1 hypothetical protein PL321_10570 [Caloramator sp. mosi_1]
MNFIEDNEGNKLFNEINDYISVHNTDGAQSIYLKVSKDLVPKIKDDIVNKLSFKDKGLESEGFEDYINFGNLEDIEIKDTTKRFL